MFDSETIKILKNDGVGIIPTDTLYGIVGSAFSKKAVKRIYALKGRDESKPFIVLISSVNDLKKFDVALTSEQKKFLNTVWPLSPSGRASRPVSVVLPVLQKKFEYLHCGTKSLAFRLPKNEKLRAFLKKTGPLVAPSANPQGMTPATTIKEAMDYFCAEADFYVPGGKKAGKPSKLISLLGEKPEILRR
jgi:L-threonylcarbamoyladenylate synthase